MANEATQFTIGGVTHDVMDVGARQLIANLQNAINAITSGDTTTAIETFQEVIDFLGGVTDDATLIGKLNELRTLINAKYTKPNTGIPASDLAESVQDTLDDVATKANSSEVVKGINDSNGNALPKNQDGTINLPASQGGLTKDDFSVESQGDGTVNINVGSGADKDTYSINLNHTHENMAKLIVCEESDLPSTLDPATIYAITDSGETEIEKLIIKGMEFAGGGVPDTGMPQVTKPSTLRPLNLGNNTGSGVTALVDVKARNLNYNGSTDGLTISVGQNSGLLLSYGQTVDANSVVVSQSDAMAGTQITVKYTGSGALDDGVLVFSHDNAVLSSVVVVVVDAYAGFLFDKALSRGQLTDVQGKCVTPTFDLGGAGHFLTINFGYGTGTYGAAGYTSEDAFVDTWTASKVIRSVKLGDTVTKIRVTLDSNNLADCFIYDETDDVMLFKGSNVVFDDPYPGVVFGKKIVNGSGGQTGNNSAWCLSPILELSATGHTVSINFGFTSGVAQDTSGLAGYTADGSFVEIFDTSAAQRTIDLSSYPTIKKLMLPAYLSGLEGCYVHDDTTDEYLWKGLNVV